MSQLSKNNPIGIFDSGVGGLTVASAIHRTIPAESFIYFGDTAHLPYGDKSVETIVDYSERISRFLVQQSCKLIVIACNTASAAAYENVKTIADTIGAKVVNVIDPVVDAINVSADKIDKVAVIGTKGTITSGIYQERLKSRFSAAQIASLSTPLLAPMIEEGFVGNEVSRAVLEAYLSDDMFNGASVLIPGCTHYPILKDEIANYFNNKVEVLDTPQIVADSVFKILDESNLLTDTIEPSFKFYVSDYTQFFDKSAQKFFGENVTLKKITL